MMIYWTAATLLAALCFLWPLTRRSRRLSGVDDILKQIQPNLLTDLHEFLSFDTTTERQDERFWRVSGGQQGAFARNRNAQLLIRLCQSLSSGHQLSEEDVSYILPQAISIRFFTWVSMLEVPIRVMFPKLPHACARVAASLYADLESSVRQLLADNCPAALGQFDALL